MLQLVDKPNKFIVEMYARPGKILVKYGQMSVKVTLLRPILMDMKDNLELIPNDKLLVKSQEKNEKRRKISWKKTNSGYPLRESTSRWMSASLKE